MTLDMFLREDLLIQIFGVCPNARRDGGTELVLPFQNHNSFFHTWRVSQGSEKIRPQIYSAALLYTMRHRLEILSALHTEVIDEHGNIPIYVEGEMEDLEHQQVISGTRTDDFEVVHIARLETYSTVR
jgi:hypothetical protein